MKKSQLKSDILDQEILAYIREHPGTNQLAIISAVKNYSDSYTRVRIRCLEAAGEIRVVPARGELHIFIWEEDNNA